MNSDLSRCLRIHIGKYKGNRDIKRPENSPVDCFQWFERPENSPVESFPRERAGKPLSMGPAGPWEQP